MPRPRIQRKRQPEKRPPGRPPTPFSQELADAICDEYAHNTTLSLQSILSRNPRYPSYTLLARWLRENPEFEKQYARAKEDRANLFAEEITEIADSVEGETENGVVSAAKLRVDARKWLASKLLPKLYGDKLETVNTSKVTVEDHTGPSLSDQILSWSVSDAAPVPPRKPH